MSWVEFQVFLGQGLEDFSTFKSGWVKAVILTSTFFNLGYYQVQKDHLFSSQLKKKLKKPKLFQIKNLWPDFKHTKILDSGNFFVHIKWFEVYFIKAA